MLLYITLLYNMLLYIVTVDYVPLRYVTVYYVPSWSCSQAVWHIPLLCVQWKTADDGQRNCPKHVQFYSKNKFEKLVHLVGFVERIRFFYTESNKLCVQWKTVDDGQRNCPKHVEFYSKNKLEKLVHLVGFIIRIYHDARSPERQRILLFLH